MAEYKIVIEDIIERIDDGNYFDFIKPIIEVSHEGDFKCRLISSKRRDVNLRCEWMQEAKTDEDIIKHVENTLDFDNIHIERNGKRIWSNYPE